MSSSSEFSEFSGNKAAAKSPEKTTFSQTCSLLSQYIKEKGSFGDLTLGMTCNNTEQTGAPETSCQSATTMNLFPAKESNMTPKNLTAMNLLSPQEIPTLINNSSAMKSVSKGAKASQLTIFYAGQVIVLDDFPADKASELMSLATKGTSQSQNNSVQENQPSFAPSMIRTSADSSAPVIPGVNIIPCTGTNSIPEHAQVSSRPIVAFQKKSRPIVCDLPIARKASLHRFLEKRKDRIAAKAPYEVTNLMGHANKPAESMSWLGFGPR